MKFFGFLVAKRHMTLIISLYPPMGSPAPPPRPPIVHQDVCQHQTTERTQTLGTGSSVHVCYSSALSITRPQRNFTKTSNKLPSSCQPVYFSWFVLAKAREPLCFTTEQLLDKLRANNLNQNPPHPGTSATTHTGASRMIHISFPCMSSALVVAEAVIYVARLGVALANR